eukprot:4920000-Amphidinium_carterae.1
MPRTLDKVPEPCHEHFHSLEKLGLSVGVKNKAIVVMVSVTVIHEVPGSTFSREPLLAPCFVAGCSGALPWAPGRPVAS